MRVIDASSNASSVDVYAQTKVLFTDMGSPTFSNYAPVSPGTVALAVKPAGTQDVALSASATAVSGQQYSLLLTNTDATSGGYQASVIADQSVSAPAGQVSLRLIESAPAAGKVDVYFVPDGTLITAAAPVFKALSPGTITPYTTLAAGTYDIIITGTGLSTAKYTGTATIYTGGEVRTLLILDAKYTAKALVSVTVGSDLN